MRTDKSLPATGGQVGFSRRQGFRHTKHHVWEFHGVYRADMRRLNRRTYRAHAVYSCRQVAGLPHGSPESNQRDFEFNIVDCNVRGMNRKLVPRLMSWYGHVYATRFDVPVTNGLRCMNGQLGPKRTPKASGF